MGLKDYYVTITEAAKILHVSRQTVSTWIKEGKLPAEKVGRETLIERKALTQHEGRMIMNVSREIANKRILARNFSGKIFFHKGDKIEKAKSRRNEMVYLVTKEDGSREKIEIEELDFSIDIGKEPTVINVNVKKIKRKVIT